MKHDITVSHRALCSAVILQALEDTTLKPMKKSNSTKYLNQYTLEYKRDSRRFLAGKGAETWLKWGGLDLDAEYLKKLSTFRRDNIINKVKKAWTKVHADNREEYVKSYHRWAIDKAKVS